MHSQHSPTERLAVVVLTIPLPENVALGSLRRFISDALHAAPKNGALQSLPMQYLTVTATRRVRDRRAWQRLR